MSRSLRASGANSGKAQDAASTDATVQTSVQASLDTYLQPNTGNKRMAAISPEIMTPPVGAPSEVQEFLNDTRLPPAVMPVQTTHSTQIFDANDIEENPELLEIQDEITGQQQLVQFTHNLEITAIPPRSWEQDEEETAKTRPRANAVTFKKHLLEAIQGVASGIDASILLVHAKTHHRTGRGQQPVSWMLKSDSPELIQNVLEAAVMKQPIRGYRLQLNRPKANKKGVRFQIDLFKQNISMEAYIEALISSGFDTMTFSGAEFGTKPNPLGQGTVLAGTFDIYLHDDSLPNYGPGNYHDEAGNLKPIDYPPPKVRLQLADGTAEYRNVRRVGACRFCHGPHHPPQERCPYQGRCNRCLALLKKLPHEGFHHSCHHGITSEPNPAKTGAVQKMKQHPAHTPSTPLSEKRRQRMAMRAKKRQLDIQAAVQTAKLQMAPKSPDSSKSGRSSKSQKLVTSSSQNLLTLKYRFDGRIDQRGTYVKSIFLKELSYLSALGCELNIDLISTIVLKDASHKRDWN